MLAPESIRELITSANNHINTLQRVDLDISYLLHNFSQLEQDSQSTKFEDVIYIISKWLYSFSVKIRNQLEVYIIHRQHLILWEENGFLGSEDW